MQPDVRQPLNKTALDKVLRDRNVTQAIIAEKIGVNEKSFSRWINEGYIQSQYLWDLTEILDLSDEELDEVLHIPKYRVFFRKKFLGKVPDEIAQRATELAKTLFGLTYLTANTRFCPPNTSKINDPVEVANQIRRYTKLENFNNLSGIISGLAEQGVEVAIIPFDYLKLNSEGEHEQAFSVTDEQRCLIFLDSASPKERLIFNLCHELCHLFRPNHDYSVTEEKFCNAVAAEIVYPKSFFESHKNAIHKVINEGSVESIVNLLNNIRDLVGGEVFGISLRLKELGFLSQKDPLHKKIVSYGKVSFEKLPTVQKVHFSNFNMNNRAAFISFWDSADISKNALLRFFFHVKSGTIAEAVSARKFSELFEVNIGWVDELIHRWRNDFKKNVEHAAQ